jgi:hypothetical protein
MIFDNDLSSLLLDLVEKLLRMTPNLGTGPRLNEVLHLLPVFAEQP